mgnify:CR=1 FL=1
MDNEAKRIAEGLTEDEAWALRSHTQGKIFDGRYWRETPASNPRSWCKCGYSLRTKGLIQWARLTGEDTTLTKKGTRVRTYLEQKQ